VIGDSVDDVISGATALHDRAHFAELDMPIVESLIEAVRSADTNET
jgi:hypothetical protein